MINNTLDDWQGRLEAHFEALRRNRLARLGDRPVFALEHGLTAEELEEISGQVRAAAAAPSFQHRLPWAVYAAEVGYRYSGDEYWQTFEDETPHWGMADRPFIRRCFQNFQRRYGGAEPSGRWARRFSIICWPITHAILPKDLQKQLARILFQTRNLIRSQELASPADLGRLISARSGNCSSRFRNLAEEPLLLGQISAALLLEDEETAGLLILPTTLERISSDLDRERRARSWLRGARESVRDRLQVRGGLAPPKEKSGESGEVPTEPPLSLKPTLILRRSAPNADWDVRLEIPDFSQAIERFPEIRDTLASSRCSVAGSKSAPKPGGWLLYGAQQVRWDHWPSAGGPLLTFEGTDERLKSILASHFVISPGPCWLFKVGSDGIARQLSAHRVRPESQYVLVTSEAPQPSVGRQFAEARLQCEGVEGYFLHLPPALDAEWKHALNAWGLVTATSIEMRPIGPTPALWDGEGHIEWLTTDYPLLAVQADHQVGGYTLQCGGKLVEGRPQEPGVPVVFELAGVGEGTYRASVAAFDNSETPAHEPVEVEIRIRQPRVWKPRGHQQSAFLVVTEPYNPSLEDVWEGRFTLEAHGPRGHAVDLKLALFEKGATEPRLSETIKTLRLPCSGDDYSNAFQGYVQDSRRAQNGYEAAGSAVLQMDAQELGCFSLELEREFTPLRWSVHHTREAYFLRAVDDQDSGDHPIVSRYSFENPDVRVSLNVDRFLVGRGVEGEAGLYVLESDELRRGFVVPSEIHSLQDLKWETQLQSRRRSPDGVVELLAVSALWYEARIPGQVLAAERRRRVVEILTREILSLIGGAQWASVEDRVAESLDEECLSAAKEAVTGRSYERGLAVVLARDAEVFIALTLEDRVQRFTEVAAQFLDLPDQFEKPSNGSVPAWLCECSLRLATDPGAALRWIGQNPRAAIGCLMDNPTLVRASRFLVFAMRRFAPPLSLGAESSNTSWRWR